MSKLEEMISELCPDGVEFKYFSDVAEYIRGITYGKSDESENGIPVLRANNITIGQNVLNFDDVKHVKTTVKIKPNQFLKKDDILICAGSGSKDHIGKVAYIFDDMEFAFGGFMAVVREKNPSELLPRYMFHNLTSSDFRDYIRSTIESSTINNLNLKVISDFKIPVPPIKIQTEIVRILDSLSDSIDELVLLLEKELTLRKKQYEYYRDQLLTFSEIKKESR